MNLDDRLRRLAHHIDTELTTEAAAASAEQAPVVELGQHRRSISRPRLAAVAAAAVITIGAGGLAVALGTRDSQPAAGSSSSGPDDTTATAQPFQAAEQRPRLPTAYPAVDQQIDGATEAQGAYSMIGYDNPQRVEALIGIVSDTTLTGGIQIQAVAGTRADAQAQIVPTDAVSPTPTVSTTIVSTSAAETAPVAATYTTHETVQVWGREADVYTEPGIPQIKTVVIDATIRGFDTTLRFTGLDPVAVMAASEEFVQVVPIPPVDDSGSAPFTLNFHGPLPAGYSVVAEPTSPPNGAVVGSLSVNNTASVEGNLIQVSTYNPLPAHAAAGPLTAIDVNGTPGWMSDDPGHAVVWPVNEATYAVVGGSATTDEAITVANAVTFIDEATWRDRYGVAEPDFGANTDFAAPAPTAAPSLPEPSLAEPTTTITMVIATTIGS